MFFVNIAKKIYYLIADPWFSLSEIDLVNADFKIDLVNVDLEIDQKIDVVNVDLGID